MGSGRFRRDDRPRMRGRMTAGVRIVGNGHGRLVAGRCKGRMNRGSPRSRDRLERHQQQGEQGDE